MKRLLRCTLPLVVAACGNDDVGDAQAGVRENRPASRVAAAFEEVGETGVRELKGGLVVETTAPGRGPVARVGDTLTIHCKGVVKESGDVFDSTYGSGIPRQITLGAKEILPALELALHGSRAGSKLKVSVPAALGYGDEGRGRVPPEAELEFEVRVVRID